MFEIFRGNPIGWKDLTKNSNEEGFRWNAQNTKLNCT